MRHQEATNEVSLFASHLSFTEDAKTDIVVADLPIDVSILCFHFSYCCPHKYFLIKETDLLANATKAYMQSAERNN